MAKAAKKVIKKALGKAAGKTPKKASLKAAPKTIKKGAKKTTGKKPTRKPNAAFMAPLTVSPALAEVIGGKSLPRTEIVKKTWDYIKKNDLQDEKNRRMINADEKLKTVFEGKDQISMVELAKVINNHVK